MGETMWPPSSPLPSFMLTSRPSENPLTVILEGAQACCEDLDQKKPGIRPAFSDLLPGGGTTEATAGASERSLRCHDFSAHTVGDLKDEGP